MLSTTDVELPGALRTRLRHEADFSHTLTKFTRDHVAGFEQPVAATAAIVAPVLLAFTYALGGVVTLVEVATIFGATTVMFLMGAWYVKRQDIAWAYARGLDRRRAAHEDLKCGVGQAFGLTLRSTPIFVEHDQGVLVFADTLDGRTVFFDIDGTGTDSRWLLYVNGDLYRRHWSWMRLKGSGTIVSFGAEGAQITAPADPLYSAAPDVWEAISLALGEPRDGDVIDLPFREAKQTVTRLL